MLNHALFVVSIPNAESEWAGFLQSVNPKIQPHLEYVLRISENVWFLNTRASVSPLGWLIANAENRGFSYGILPFEGEPEWLPGGFDPSTIQGRNA